MLGTTRGKAKARATLDELLDTLRLLEEEPEPLPRPKAYHKDRYAWTDEASGHLVLTTMSIGQEASTGVRAGWCHHFPALIKTLTRARCGLLTSVPSPFPSGP